LETSKDDPEALPLFRLSFLRLVTAEYWNMVDHGILPVEQDILQDLLASVDHAKDFLTAPQDAGLKDWEYMDHLFSRIERWDNLCFRGKCGCLGRCVSKHLHDNTATEILCFIGAHETAQRRAEKHLVGCWQQHVLQESAECVRQAENFLDQKLAYRDVAQVKTWQLSRALLEFQRIKIEKWVSHGIINAGEAHSIMHHIDHGTGHLATVQFRSSVNQVFSFLSPRYHASPALRRLF